MVQREGLFTIELYEKVEYKETPTSYEKSFLSKSKEAFVSGWDFISNLTLGIIYIWPLLIVGGFIFYGFRRRRKRKKHE